MTVPIRKFAALMFQGTGSDVGKSMLVAGLARAFSRRGLSVAPFKPQNMSNNAAVTADGGEIGRAQALQARACGLLPHTDMNPVLLKPQSETGAQIVVQGKVYGSAKAREYQVLKASLMPRVLESFERLGETVDLVLVEGAGSAAEVNLRKGDIANMGFAIAAKVPVVLVGDIDRGGVIASICGTTALISPPERALLCGYLINKFRGDPSLFDSGIDVIAARTELRCFGVVPWFEQARSLPAEDALALPNASSRRDAASIRIGVLTTPRISNFDDFDPLVGEVDVDLTFIRSGEAIPGNLDLVILPGSKSTLADLAALRDEGWDVDIQAHVRRGGFVLGVCGGYQMLGRTLRDPDGIEGPPMELPGLCLLDVDTCIAGDKTLRHVTGTHVPTDTLMRGYEMHIGVTSGEGLAQPMLSLDDSSFEGVAHGAISADGKVMGCYVHGVFSDDAFRHAFLCNIRERESSGHAYEASVDATLDALAEHLEQSLAVDELLRLSGARNR